VSDEAGQPLVGGTVIKFTGVNVDVSPSQITLPDSDLMPGPNITEFTVTLTNPVTTPASTSDRASRRSEPARRNAQARTATRARRSTARSFGSRALRVSSNLGRD